MAMGLSSLASEALTVALTERLLVARSEYLMIKAVRKGYGKV